MRASKKPRRLPPLLLMALAAAGAQAGERSVPDVAVDPAAAWTTFLATADVAKAYPAYEALTLVGYDGDRVDATKCGENLPRLREAVAAVPVSIALHRALMQCADAGGDTPLAERELAAVAALVKHALAGTSESTQARPISVLRQHDMRALVLAMGLEPQYAYYPLTRHRRWFPEVVAAWDPQRKVERQLRFDFLDATYEIARSDPRYPFERSQLVQAVLDAQRKADIGEGIDWMAWKAGRIEDAPAAKVAQFRQGATAGGIQSARTWVEYCTEADAPKDCAEGLVDTLLPLAEKKQAWPMMLLAYAYSEGLGVSPDPASGGRLLDAADARWARMGGSVEYVRLWRETHGDAALPGALQRRLERAEAAGNEDARVLRVAERLRVDPAAALTNEDIAFLSLPGQNGQGAGFSLLAAWAEDRKARPEQERWLRLAADAGDPDAQEEVGFTLAYGEDLTARDKPAGLRYLTAAAHGGSSFAARMLAYEAEDAGDYAAAESWLIDPAGYSFDVEAMLALADLYEWERPGVHGNPERAITMYRNLADAGINKARRRLAMMASEGRHMAKDPAQARSLLEAAAKDGDHEAEGLLGYALLTGKLGSVDEPAGVRWIERALKGGDDETAASYGHWLFYTKATDASRAKAVEVWRQAMAKKDRSSANNLAWALCTAPVDGFRDAKAGMAATREMGPIEDLTWGSLDTVAACRAADGDFAGAVELQKQVVERWHKQASGLKSTADIEKQTKELEERLALYEAGKTYIEPPEAHEG